jgi:hypothetical protein
LQKHVGKGPADNGYYAENVGLHVVEGEVLVVNISVHVNEVSFISEDKD